MESYLTVFEENVSEFCEKRSRFIATLRHCETEEEAVAFLEEMRTKYWDAKHNVFGFNVEKGRTLRFSDDGEPHGTAGKPILDVIVGSGLTDIAIVVTRYFGGVLLGTGGLVRAYSKSAKDAIESAQIYEMIPSLEYETVCEYTDHSKLENLIVTCGGNIINTDFTDKVKLSYVFIKKDTDSFLKKLCENFSARLTANEICEKMLPFKKILEK